MWTKILFLVSFGISLIFEIQKVGASEYEDSVNVSAVLHGLTIGYDKQVRPNYGGDPVTVGVSIYILSVLDLSENDMDFTFDMYFRQFWHEPRLAFERRLGLDKLVVGAETAEKFWVPDTFFVNEKTSYIHQRTVENQFFRIMHNGDVLRSLRMNVKASCPMDLQYFPKDTQMCTLEIESFGYTMSDIKFRWEDGKNSVRMSPDSNVPQFNILGHRQRIIEASLSSGNYSRLLLDIVFERAVGSYIIQVYIPSNIIVCMSWVSLWLDREAATARVGLGVTAMISLMTMTAGVNATLPKVSYLKSIDIYLGVCLFMAFGVIVEYAMVGYVAKIIRKRKNIFFAVMKINEDRKEETNKHMNNIQESASPTQQAPPDRLFGIKASFIDWCSRIIFPFSFLAFNIGYWAVYLSIPNDVEDLVMN